VWNLRHVSGSTTTDFGNATRRPAPAVSATRAAHPRPPRLLLRRALLLLALLTVLLTVLPLACATSTLTAPAVRFLHHSSAMASRPCAAGMETCSDDGGAPISPSGPSHGVDNGLPAPAAPPCEALCARIQRTYHDPRTQALLLPLAQTPTGRAALDYLLTMGDRLGEGFITWRDLGADGGENNAGGYIQLNSAALMRHDLGPYYLAGTLVHETVESSFDIGEGLRDMGTRHADYVAQWFNGRFARELHALPYYAAQDPFYLPSEDSAYGLSYAAWLQTADGRLYLSNPENCNLRKVDRRGRAWPPSDGWAEQGGWWVLGQGTDVTPVPNPLGLSPAMLAADDLTALAS
jgi:hypothetical protein